MMAATFKVGPQIMRNIPCTLYNCRFKETGETLGYNWHHGFQNPPPENKKKIYFYIIICRFHIIMNIMYIVFNKKELRNWLKALCITKNNTL